MLSANINVQVYVELTPLGEKIIEEYNEQFRMPHHDAPHKKEWDGFYKFPLWELMGIFGQHLSIGSDTPFEGNKIHFIK
jgi:hypothetical protein